MASVASRAAIWRMDSNEFVRGQLVPSSDYSVAIEWFANTLASQT